MSIQERGIVSEGVDEQPVEEDTSPEAGSPLAPVPAPAPLNGFDVADWLIEPLFDAAVNGLETMVRTDVPPRLIPLTGRRHPKLSRAHREAILTALGRHEKFTDAAFDRLFEDKEAEAGAIEGATVEEVIGMIEQAELDVALAVCLLFAAGQPDDAEQVAEWATQKDEASGTLLAGMVDALSRENLEAQERLRRVDQELARERRARRALERKIASATTTAESARAQATKAESRAGWTRVEANAEAARAEALMHELATAHAALEAGRRERRDLLGELRESEDRYQRARRELREVRARLPVEVDAPELELRSEEAAPTTADLRDRFVQFGARGVLDAKRLLLLVDGWNVSLGHIGAARLEDKRRVLEQALERYKSRTGNKVMVVYDGRKVSWFWMPRAEGRTIARIFTEGETADDFIVAELEAESRGPDAPVVVTSDRELRKRCIAQGAFVVSSEDLASVLEL
ncbi:MAG: YacP-like domain [Actinomycetota bacterium]|nr:YacP-like domain [Actinomycetota bacterium]